jgi:hypothetical protein
MNKDAHKKYITEMVKIHEGTLERMEEEFTRLAESIPTIKSDLAEEKEELKRIIAEEKEHGNTSGKS